MKCEAKAQPILVYWRGFNIVHRISLQDLKVENWMRDKEEPQRYTFCMREDSDEVSRQFYLLKLVVE